MKERIIIKNDAVFYFIKRLSRNIFIEVSLDEIEVLENVFIY